MSNTDSPWVGRGLTRLRDGRRMCCICFEYRTKGELYTDVAGDTWDVCKGPCATQAGFPDE